MEKEVVIKTIPYPKELYTATGRGHGNRVKKGDSVKIMGHGYWDTVIVENLRGKCDTLHNSLIVDKDGKPYTQRTF